MSPQQNLRYDPASLEVLWTRLVSMVDESAAHLVRIAFSEMMREANDYAVILTDRHGQSLAQSSKSIPAFICTLPATVRHFLERYPIDSLKPGDALITNDPWNGTGHLPDVNIAMPIFHRGKAVGMASAVSHLPDIGGRMRNLANRELYEEGLLIPPLKLMKGGEPDPALVALIGRNVRVPRESLGDIWALVSACRMLERRVVDLLDETGVDLNRVGAEVQRRSESAMRRAIADTPDGTYRNIVEQDGFDDDPIIIDCKLTVKGDSIAIDYSGSTKQLPRAVNVVPIYTFAYSAYILKCIMAPGVPNNEGSFKPLTTFAPEGSILGARHPAPVGGRHVIGHLLAPAVMGALSSVRPADIQATPGASACAFNMSGEHEGRRYAMVTFMSAGQGAAQHRDGLSTISFPTNQANTPIEVLEADGVIRVHERRVRPRSGGTGRRRGGDGLVFDFEVTADTPATAAFIVMRRKCPAPGLFGGGPGKVGRLLLNGSAVDPAGHYVLSRGDRVRMESSGGGGFGASDD